VMLAASFDLIHEGEPYGGGYVIAGVGVGALFIAFMQRLLHDCEDVKFAALEAGSYTALSEAVTGYECTP
jgi:hypothetical protein